MAKVEFYGSTGIIQVIQVPSSTGYIDLDIKSEVYNEWKLWVATSDNSKYLQALYSVGGDPLPGDKALGSTFFLINGWKIRPYSADHTFRVNGNLYCDDGSSPFVPTVGSYNVMVISTVSSLVDSVLQQLPEIEYASFLGGVTINVLTGSAGTAFPLGTPQSPVNNLADAKTIAVARGFDILFVIGNLTLGATDVVSNYTIVGQGASFNASKTTITMTSGCTTSNTIFKECRIEGRQSGETIFHTCVIGTVTNTHCQFTDCGMAGPVTMVNSGWTAGHTTDLMHCHTSSDWYILDYNASPIKQVYSDFSGKLKLINFSHASGNILIQISAGEIWLDSTCTNGNITLRGVGTLIDDSIGGTLNINGLVNKATVADAVLNTSLITFTGNNTVSDSLQILEYANEIHIDELATSSGIVYPFGTPAHPVNNLADALLLLEHYQFRNLCIHGDLTLHSGDDVSNFSLIGRGATFNIAKTTITLESGCITANTHFEDCKVTGVQGGEGIFKNCVIGSLSNTHCEFTECKLTGPVTLVNSSWTQNHSTELIACLTGNDYFIVDYNASPIHQIYTRFNGHIKFINCTDSRAEIHIFSQAGRVWIDSSCTAGMFMIHGNMEVTDESIGATVMTSGTISQALITNTILSTSSGLYPTVGTIGGDIANSRKMDWNKAIILSTSTGETVTIYDDNGIDILRQFTISADKMNRTPV